mgnify:CR=1 FL=1
MEDQTIISKALEIGRKIRTANGIEDTVNIIEEFAKEKLNLV